MTVFASFQSESHTQNIKKIFSNVDSVTNTSIKLWHIFCIFVCIKGC